MALAGVAIAEEPKVLWDMDFASTGVTLTLAEGVTTNLASNVGASLITDGTIRLITILSLSLKPKVDLVMPMSLLW